VGWIVGEYDSIGGDIYRLLVITVTGDQLLAIAIAGEVVVGDYDCGNFLSFFRSSFSLFFRDELGATIPSERVKLSTPAIT